MNKTCYHPLIFELSHPGVQGYSLPQNPWPTAPEIPVSLQRDDAPELPDVDEPTIVRHYTNMSTNNFGVDTGFYPLGSCTMKYNPKINEEMAALPAFTRQHPAAPTSCAQGALALYHHTTQMLSSLTGLSQFTLNPYAGAHGELTGLMVIKAYHAAHNAPQRTKIIVPDSAHGTNPASAAVCEFQVVQVASATDGTVDLDDLERLLGDDIAGMMMTNPNTLGLFEHHIPEIAQKVHDCGGLMYYDGANFNAIMGICRPGDMGFDVMHLNLHKSFSTPHGGGGPGSGPVGVRKGLERFLPNPRVVQYDDGIYDIKQHDGTLGQISSWLGNFGIIVRAYAYLLTLGKEEVANVARLSVLNANYIKERLKEYYELPLDRLCKHECVFDGLREEYGGKHSDPSHVTTLDVAKRLLDYGYHAPTIYFPLLFHEALMIEPTETESRATLDAFVDTMIRIAEEAREHPEMLHTAPHDTPIRRPDDVLAARQGKFVFTPTPLSTPQV
jgi:glycine dehydrogenase subunit 2